MRIAVLGGGFTGMTAAHYLAVKGHEVTLIEKEKVLGGLVVGFKQPNWDWYIERAYHHLLGSENDILDFAEDTGFSEIFFKATLTSSLYEVDKDIFRTFSVDTPQDFLKLPLLSFPEKIRAGIALALLKFSPFLPLYEKYTAEEFLRKTQGDHVWEVLWQELFRKKFGKYAENILATFIWARISKRSKKLGYIKGGFQTFIDYIEKSLKGLGVNILTGYEIEKIEKRADKFLVLGHSGERSDSRIVVNKLDSRFPFDMTRGKRGIDTVKNKFDAVISTLPTVIMSKITRSIFPASYLDKFSKLKQLHAVVIILETKQPILDKTYWLNVCTPKIPIMIVAQHTNFVDKKHYGGNHLAYVGWYVNLEDRLLRMEDRELLTFITPYLKKINPNYSVTQLLNYFKFVGPFAQPIYDKEFLKNKPDFITPVKNFYIANLDMTYPYDRGTNYAVKLGRDVSNLIE